MSISHLNSGFNGMPRWQLSEERHDAPHEKGFVGLSMIGPCSHSCDCRRKEGERDDDIDIQAIR